MGAFLDQLRKRLKEKQDKANAVKSFKKLPKKDITFLPATTAPGDITNYVNARMLELITQSGGEDRFVDGDFTIQYVDKTSPKDFVQTKEIELQENLARNMTGSNDEYDWEAKSEATTTSFTEGLNADSMQFYMIIIEYTHLLEVL